MVATVGWVTVAPLVSGCGVLFWVLLLVFGWWLIVLFWIYSGVSFLDCWFYCVVLYSLWFVFVC